MNSSRTTPSASDFRAQVVGAVDGVAAGLVFGWVAVAGAAKGAPELGISLDGKQVASASVKANTARPDIVAGNALGFHFDLGPFLRKKLKHRIDVVNFSTGKPLDGRPLKLDPASAWAWLDELQDVEVSGWMAPVRMDAWLRCSRDAQFRGERCGNRVATRRALTGRYPMRSGQVLDTE